MPLLRLTKNQMKNKFTLLPFFYLISISLSIASERDSLKRDSTIFLREGIVVTGLRMSTHLQNVPDAIVTFPRPGILRLSPMSTPDAMGNMAGVWMQKTNHGGGSPFIRGLTGYHTLLLVDGIRFNNSTFRSGPNQYLNTTDPLTLERIEVLRGQGSVQYGTDAIGGVGHLFLREPSFASSSERYATGRLYGRIMSHDMEYSGRAEIEAGTSTVAFLGGIDFKNFGDIHAGGDLGTLKSTGYNEFSWDAKVRAKLGSIHVTAVWQHLVQHDVPLYHQLGAGKYSRYHFDPQQRDLGYVRFESLHSSAILSQIRYTVAYQNSLEKRVKQKSGDVVTRHERDNVDTYHAGLEVLSKFTPHWKASSGIELYHDRIASDAEDTNDLTQERNRVRGLYPDGTTYSNLAAFSIHAIEWNRFTFSLGGRYNFIRLNVNDPFFGYTTIKPSAAVWNVGVIFKPTKYLQLISSANTGFRAPNVNDVASFGVADYRYEVPNYELAAEKSLQFQTGLRIKTGKIKTEFFIYQNDLSDLIGNVVGTYNNQDSLEGFKVYQKENINEARIRGVEADVHINVTRWLTAFGNFTYTKGDNLTRSEPLSRIPPSFGRLGFDMALNKFFTWRIEGIAAGKQSKLSSGDQQDSRIPTGGTSSWTVVNSRLQYSGKPLTISAGIQNIFDKNYRIHGSGIDGLGRSVWVSFVFELSTVR